MKKKQQIFPVIEAQTYICGCEGASEYGYTFKCSGGDDSLFDIVLGKDSSPNGKDIAPAFKKFRPMAKFIAAAMNARIAAGGRLP